MKKSLLFLTLFAFLANIKGAQTPIGPVGFNKSYPGVAVEGGENLSYSCDTNKYIDKLSFHSGGTPEAPNIFVNSIGASCSDDTTFAEEGAYKDKGNAIEVASPNGFSGIAARGGSWIDSLTPLDANGNPLKTVGGTGGGDQGTLQCPPGQLLVGIYPTVIKDATKNKFPYLANLSISCSAVTKPAEPAPAVPAVTPAATAPAIPAAPPLTPVAPAAAKAAAKKCYIAGNDVTKQLGLSNANLCGAKNITAKSVGKTCQLTVKNKKQQVNIPGQTKKQCTVSNLVKWQ